MTDAIHPMRIVAERTGISPHVIRAWERRHGAIAPQRTDGNRRLYTQADIDRLLLLRKAVAGGYSIAQLAKLSLEELESISGGAQHTAVRSPTPAPPPNDLHLPSDLGDYLRLALEATHDLDPLKLERVLGRVVLDEGRNTLVNEVIQALLEEVGELWRRGEIRPYHEHLAVAVIRKTLGDLISQSASPEAGLVLVLSTPNGTFHELGCLMAASAASAVGWKSVYLGTSLPAEEIAGAARQTHARAVGVSVVYPAGNPQILNELRDLRQLLPQDVALLIGGRAAKSYSEIDGNVTFIDDLEALTVELALLSVSKSGDAATAY